jgi:hypothetical protein
MNNTEALDLHGLTRNQYVYLEALLANITTARWTGDTSFRFMPNVGSPAPYMGFITKPLNEVNLLKLLSSEIPLLWGTSTNSNGTYLQQQGRDVRYSIQISVRHVPKGERLITNAQQNNVHTANGNVIPANLCVPNYVEALNNAYEGTLFLRAYNTITLLYMSHKHSGAQPTRNDIPALDDVLTMLEGYGDYHTITYVGDPATVANTETPKRYSGESGVELSYDTSDSKKHPFRFKVAAFFVWLFGLSILVFPVAGILAIFQVPFAGYVALGSIATLALSSVLVDCLVTKDEFDALEYNGTLRETM